MEYLIIDDEPRFLTTWRRTLEASGHTICVVRDLTSAWNLLVKGKHFDLVVIDIALDRREAEFEKEYAELQAGLAARGKGGLPMSGQALGLRLWRQRASRKQPYCYFTHNFDLWLEGQNSSDTEFSHLGARRSPELVIEKIDVFAHNVEAKFENALEIWGAETWFQ